MVDDHRDARMIDKERCEWAELPMPAGKVEGRIHPAQGLEQGERALISYAAKR
jgi:hypothetical protein